GLPSGHSFGVGREDREVAIPARGQFTALHQFNLGCQFGKLGAISRKELLPLLASLAPARANAGSEMRINAVRHKKFRVFGPPVIPFTEANLLLPERLPMSFGSVLFVRGTVADVAVQNNERRPLFGLAENIQSPLDAVDVVGITDAQDVPSIGQETAGHIL